MVGGRYTRTKYCTCTYLLSVLLIQKQKEDDNVVDRFSYKTTTISQTNTCDVNGFWACSSHHYLWVLFIETAAGPVSYSNKLFGSCFLRSTCYYCSSQIVYDGSSSDLAKSATLLIRRFHANSLRFGCEKEDLVASERLHLRLLTYVTPP